MSPLNWYISQLSSISWKVITKPFFLCKTGTKLIASVNEILCLSYLSVILIKSSLFHRDIWLKKSLTPICLFLPSCTIDKVSS